METPEPTRSRISILSILSRFNWHAWLPSRGNVLFTLVLIVALFWAQSAHALPWANQPAAATSTGTWPYQGRLADAAGTPITATVPMIFRLYNAASGGSPLWEEQWTGPNSVQVSDGLFNVMLGSLNAIPQSLVTSNSSLWLGITAGTDNEMTPRIQLGSVPFAAQALTVPDGSITAAKLASNSVTTAKIADGAITQAKLGTGVSLIPPDGSITTAKIADGAVIEAKLGIDVNHAYIQSGYYIGFDQTTPGWNLHTGTGQRTFTTHIDFPNAFDANPTIVLGIASFWCKTGKKLSKTGLSESFAP